MPQAVGHGGHRIAKAQPGDGGGIVHLFAGLRVLSAKFVGPGQVVKDELAGLQAQAIGKVVGPLGGIALDGVGQDVHAGVGRDLGRQMTHKFRIDDSQIGDVLGMADGDFAAFFQVGQDDGPGGFGARAAGGGNSDEVRLLAQPQIAYGRYIVRCQVGALVLDPYRLGRIKAGTAAQADDPVRLVGPRLLRPARDRLQRRVGFHLGKDSRLYPRLLELRLDPCHKAQGSYVGIGDDKGFLALDPGQVFQCAATKDDLGAAEEPHCPPPEPKSKRA